MEYKRHRLTSALVQRDQVLCDRISLSVFWVSDKVGLYFISCGYLKPRSCAQFAPECKFSPGCKFAPKVYFGHVNGVFFLDFSPGCKFASGANLLLPSR